MIEVVLLERVENLGPMGHVAKVRPGFARNYLLPNKKALRATKTNLEVFEKQRAELEAQNAARRTAAEGFAAKIDNAKVIVIRQASEMGHLYGSVTARDVAEAATEAGHTIDRQQIQIDTPIKTLGLFPVKVKLHPEVTVKVTVNVARSKEEAIVQAEKGVAVLKAALADEARLEAATEETPVLPEVAMPGAEQPEYFAEAPKPKKTTKAKKVAE